jgi:hypothetical protein
LQSDAERERLVEEGADVKQLIATLEVFKSKNCCIQWNLSIPDIIYMCIPFTIIGREV